MASLEEIKEIRLKKLNKLREVGVDPYPAKVSRDFDLIEVKNDFADLEKSGKEFSVAGRVMAIRGQGAIFLWLYLMGQKKFKLL